MKRLSRWLASLRATAFSGRSRKRSLHSRRPVLEALEPRRVLSALSIQLDTETRDVTIQGSASDDSAIISVEDGQYVVRFVGGTDKIIETFAPGDVDSFIYHGGPGNDLVKNNTSLPLVAFGGEGHDELYGGSAADLLVGGEGNDLLHSGHGPDILIGGAGADVLEAQGDEDLLIGDLTDYDTDLETLQNIVAIWRTGLPYSDRIAILQSRDILGFLRSGETVHDDGVVDALFGNSSTDWFFQPGEDFQGDSHAHPGEPSPHDHAPNITDARALEQVDVRLPHIGDPLRQVEHVALFNLVARDEATHTSVSSGVWSDPNIWTGGVVPGIGARVVIASDHAVKVNGVYEDTPIKTLRVDGILHFAIGQDSTLSVETLVVDGDGRLVMGTPELPVRLDVTAKIVIADFGPIAPSKDPLQLGKGVISHGEFIAHGAEKTHVMTLRTHSPTELVLRGVPTNWQVGDQLVIAGTPRNGLEDESRTIVAIDGNRVTVEALAFDHTPPQLGLPVHVINTTRNVVIESANPDQLDRRGHVMFMHTREVDVNYAGFYDLGRTNKLERINDVELDFRGDVLDGTGTNVRGRYAVHFHRNGVVNDGNPAQVHGAAVVNSPGLGYVNHTSFVEITDSVAHNVNGAAFFTEAGDEIGLFEGNVSIRNVGSDDSIDSRTDIQDFGHQGDGFWFQGGGVAVRNNVASGATGHGFIFFTRGLIEEGVERMFRADNLVNPSIAEGEAEISVRATPIREFSGNIAYGNQTGVETRQHLLSAEHSARSVLKNLLLYNNKTGVANPYTQNTTLRNVTVISTSSNETGVGIVSNQRTANIVYENLFIEGYHRGLTTPQRGNNLIQGGYFDNAQNIVILATDRREPRSLLITGAVTFGPWDIGSRFPSTPQRIVLEIGLDPNAPHTDGIFLDDEIILNFEEFQMQQLFYIEQSAKFVPFFQSGTTIPEQYVGKTNQQLWDEFGIAIGGQIAPGEFISPHRINGMVAL